MSDEARFIVALCIILNTLLVGLGVFAPVCILINFILATLLMIDK